MLNLTFIEIDGIISCFAEAWRNKNAQSGIHMYFSISPNSIQIQFWTNLCWSASNIYSLIMKLLLVRWNHEYVSINLIKSQFW